MADVSPYPRWDPAWRPPLDRNLPFPPEGEAEHPNLKELIYANLDRHQIVADVGCGPGPFEYNRFPPRFLAIDRFPPGSLAGMKDGDLFIIQDAERLPLAGASVDMVVFGYILEHVRQPLAYLQEADRVLRSGGYLYVAVPIARSLEDRLFRLATSVAGSRRGPHIQRFTFESIPELAHTHTGLRQIAWHRLRASFLFMAHPKLRWLRGPWVRGLVALKSCGLDFLRDSNAQYVFRKQ